MTMETKQPASTSGEFAYQRWCRWRGESGDREWEQLVPSERLAWERTAADLVREDAWRRARQGETPRCEPLESEPLRDTQWLASDATIAQMVDGLKMLHIERDRNRQREVEIAEARIRLETGLEQAVTGLLDCDAPCDDCDPIRLLLPPDTLITLLPNDGRPSLLIERLPIVEHVGGEEEAREGAKARSETSRT